MPPGNLGLNHVTTEPKMCHLMALVALCHLCPMWQQHKNPLCTGLMFTVSLRPGGLGEADSNSEFAPVPFVPGPGVTSACVQSTGTCLCFLFPFYRTECSEHSCYCMCLMSHMEAVRLQECFGNIMPGTDNLSSSSFILSHCFCCHTHLELFTPLPREAGISLPHFLLSMG